MSEGALVTFAATVLGGLISLGSTWGMMRFQERARRRENEMQVLQFKHAIFCEVDAFVKSYMSVTGSALEKCEEGRRFMLRFPVGEDYFPIFENNTSLLMAMDSAQRKLVVSVYAAMKVLIDGFRNNDELIAEYNGSRSSDAVSGRGMFKNFNRVTLEFSGDLAQHRAVLVERHTVLMARYHEFCEVFAGHDVGAG